MNKIISRSISVFAAFALAFGTYYSTQASSIAATLIFANPYYVSTTGNDANPGTLAAPFKTISKAMGTALVGDSIYVRAGTYPAFAVSKSGIIIAGYTDEMPLISGGIGIRCYNASNITIKGFEVTGVTGNYIGAIMLDNCSNVVVDGNKVHANTSASVSGITISGSNNKVVNNEIYNNNFSGIRVSGTSVNNEIAFNRVYNHTLSRGDSDGIDLYGSAVTKTNIHDNTVFGNSDDGIDTWDSPGNIIKNNLAYGNGGTGDGNGFKFGGNATGGNNTVVGNTAYSNMTCGFTSNGSGNYYESNTSYNNGTCGFDDSWRTPGDTITSSYINNLAYNNPTGNFKKSPYTTVFISNLEIPSTAVTSVTPSALPIANSTSTSTVAPSLIPNSTIPSATITSSPVPLSPTNTQISILPSATPTTLVLSASPTFTSTSVPQTATSAVINLPSTETVFDNRNSAFVYSSGWQDMSKSQAYGGSYKLTTKNGSYVTFAFTGQSFSVIYKSGPTYRKMKVYVDNVLVGTINEKTLSSAFQLRWDYPGLLISGSHTLKLVFATTNTSDGTNGSIDAVVVR